MDGTGAPSRDRSASLLLPQEWRPSLRLLQLAPHVAQKRFGIERAADYALERLRGGELAAVAVDVFAQPLGERGEVAAADLPVEVRQVGARPLPDLRGRDVPERVAGEVAHQRVRPVHVLQDTGQV